MSWFSRRVDGMPDMGQATGWTATSWRSAPARAVPVDKLVSTNRRGYLSKARVAKYAKGDHGDPYVVEHRGRLYVADGHHRAAAAIARGDKTITVRVKKAPGH